MHMSDALISPIVGTTMLIASTVGLSYSAKKMKLDLNEEKIPLMGVMGAFIFASQMINFAIPATGSSGHLGGGMILAALLGPFAGFIVMASILLIQALFFGDGGLLALGCNIINLGVYTCFVAYPLIYRPITKKVFNTKSITIASIISVIVALQLGAFSVVVQTVVSGVTDIPFTAFVLLMQPIHLAIGIVEGIITAAVLCFVYKTRPEILTTHNIATEKSNKKWIYRFAIIALIIAGGLSLFASTNPDGLEWAIEGVVGHAELSETGGIYSILSNIQEKTSLFMDYAFAPIKNESISGSFAGIVGGSIFLALSAIVGSLIHLSKKYKNRGI